MSKAGRQFQLTRAMRLDIERKRELLNRSWWFWLSYMSEETGFLGAVILEAKTAHEAAVSAWNRGYAPAVNPSVLRVTERDEKALLDMTPESFRNRFLTVDDLDHLKTLGHQFTTSLDMDRMQKGSEAKRKEKEEQMSDPLLKKAVEASQEARKNTLVTLG